jgi:uroporphyrinogen-III synthase
VTRRTLSGKTVIITRGEEKAAPLAKLLEDLGAATITVPATRHERVKDEAAALRLIEQSLGASTHVIFTSQTAVSFFLALLARRDEPAALLARKRIAAVGPATGEALREAGLEPAIVATEGGGASLARRLLEEEKLGRGHSVLLPRSAIARLELEQALAEAGVKVDAVSIYETVPESPEKAAPVLELVRRGAPPDAVVFASPSALRGFLSMTAPHGSSLLESAAVRIVTIGPTTSEAVRGAGFAVAAEANAATPEDLAKAVVSALAGGGSR